MEIRFPGLTPESELPDRVSLALDDIGPVIVHDTGPDEAPVWRVFFSPPAAAHGACAALSRRLAPLGLAVSAIDVADDDWAARSQAHLTRVSVGRLTIAPPWDSPAPEDGPLVVIHPSTGFGTGHHETTRLCLDLLQELALPGRRVLDIGTGSGVLALAAVRLGASEVEGLDTDEDALDNARGNARLNHLEGALRFTHADLRLASVAAADVVLANLTGALLTAEADRLSRLVRDGGALIVSGFLGREVAQVHQACQRTMRLAEARQESAWHAALFTKGAAAEALSSERVPVV